jgi:predicted MFS family arabinose efflux permease
MLNAGSIVGRIIPNFLADIFGPLNLFAIMSFASSATAFALYGAEKSTGALIAVTVLYGMTSGAFVSLLGPALFSFAKNQAEVGKRGGFAFLALSFAALTGSPIGGALVDRYGFNVAIAFCGSTLGAGGACIAVAAFMKGSEKGTRRV